ncbi:DUF6279 family lipoprotein [Bdellovibrio svalbardensis]|uniref:DUF6279 family lipoprotein n=1 Tax=Bdellovibrio svalbardensis TaxID=2972972 RepID=A0ABT6DMV6_9BACT|nr:DUF6279 family lipoprotein [Bdellovibrio svalbardensis]MDG0818113.1 DUF6279 family lipoprotein [Bdellovibrio svalbardensis]
MNRVLLCLCLSFVFLTGCSRLDIAFRWADTYIASKVDDYFDISSKQSKELKNDINKDLQAIRTEVLPTWIERLKGIQKEVNDGPLSEDRVSFYFALFLKDIEQINSKFSDTAVDFIATTNPEQITYFTKAFHKKNMEDLEKFQDKAKFKSEYRDKYIDWFEMFIGSLNKEQKNMLEESLNTSPFPADLKVKNKEFVFQKFLRETSSTEQMKAFVKNYYSNPESYDLPEYREALAKYQKDMQKLVAQVLSTLTPEQKSSLKENLSEKIAQLHRIATRS